MANNTFQPDLFKDRVAVVTGGTSGIGAATAFYLADLGAKVYALGLKADALEIPEGLDIEAVEFDVTDEEGAKEFFTGLEQLDILFNGAGVNLPNQFDYKVYKKTMDINADSVFYLSSLAQPLLAKSEVGSIVNVSSMMAIFGSELGVAYSASKGAVDQITKSLADAYAKDNIRVNAVAPGWVRTPLMDAMPSDLKDSIIKRTPMKRFGDPVEVGQVVAFLSSPAASFVTGTILPVDGAYSISIS